MPPMDDLTRRFAYHPPSSDEVILTHRNVRAACLEVAEQWDMKLPEGREKSLALTKLEEAMFWANAAIARHQ